MPAVYDATATGYETWDDLGEVYVSPDLGWSRRGTRIGKFVRHQHDIAYFVLLLFIVDSQVKVQGGRVEMYSVRRTKGFSNSRSDMEYGFVYIHCTAAHN